MNIIKDQINLFRFARSTPIQTMISFSLNTGNPNSKET